MMALPLYIIRFSPLQEGPHSFLIVIRLCAFDLGLFLKFQKGGKMVATGGGVSFALAPLAAACCVGVWLAVFVGTRYASVASLATAAALPLFCLLFGEPWPTVAFAAVTCVAVFFMHRQNIRRLAAGEESRFELGRRAG